MTEIEEKIWNYIDGNCTAIEHETISKLIESDDAYRKKYDELLILNTDMALLELEEPPMAFTYNVMETVRTEAAMVPLRSAINKNLIRGLAGISIGIIVLLIGYAFLGINWNLGSNGTVSNFKLPQIPALSAGADNFLIKGAMFFVTILGLLMADAYLRNRRVDSKI